MSRYAWFTCTNCKTMVGLGKVVANGSDKISYFHSEFSNGHPNSEQTVLNRTIWKMLVDHAGHPLSVVTDEDAQYEHLGQYIEIGGDQYGDIDFESYLEDWQG